MGVKGGSRIRKAQIIGILLITVLLTFALAVIGFATPIVPTAMSAPDAANEVHVSFFTSYIYEVPGDALTNGEVTGKMDWHTKINNTPDETGAVVKNLKVTLTNPDNGALIYEWSYGDVPEGPGTCWTPDAVYFGDIKHHPCTFTPGFDASLSFDKTVFTAPDTQTVTITVIPRDERATGHFGFEVVTRFESDLVDAVIISPTGGEDFELSPEGKVLSMYFPKNLELNTPSSATATLQVTPKVPKVEFRPGISMGIGSHGETSGTTTGSSVSYTNEIGTWTVSAEGDYVWDWRAKSPEGYWLDWDARVLTSTEEIRDIIILISVIAVATGLGVYFFRRRRRRVV